MGINIGGFPVVFLHRNKYIGGFSEVATEELI
jgi:hypothetical protein